MSLRALALAFVLAGVLWFSFVHGSSFARRTYDLVDPRPARSILIIGNSRTYYNEMPLMIRRIADSAGSPAKFQIETSAKPGFTLAMHWADDRTEQMLEQGWDDVILQGASGEQSDQQSTQSFLAHGKKLADAAKINSGRPRLVVNWAYDPSLYKGDSGHRIRHLGTIKAVHAELAGETGMSRINLAGLWESVRQSHPSMPLTTDGNHPTLAGSYLYALAIYAHLTMGPVAGATYAPDGLDPKDAEALRKAVDSFPLLTT